jgi:transaldolase
MSDHYFARVRAETSSRFWVNNPTQEEARLAIEHGAMGCTTNPAYGGGLLKRAPAEVTPIVRECLTASQDDALVADLVQRRLVGRIAEAFLPLYERTSGYEGFVSIQGAPETDTEAAVILEEARAARTIAPNVTPKIPATAPGREAMDAIVAEGSQVIVTEVFSLAQLIEVCERWLAVTRRTGVRPPFLISPITGIFGDHLKKLAARDGLEASTSDMELMGVILSRRCFQVVRDRGYPPILLFGGARIPLDFTGLVGGGHAATINWSTAAELLATDPPVEETIGAAVDPDVVRRLSDTFMDVRRALDPEGLELEEFEAFGPVQHFRDNFITGWNGVLGMIREARREGIAASV